MGLFATELRVDVSTAHLDSRNSLHYHAARDALMVEARRLFPNDIVLRIENVRNTSGTTGSANANNWLSTAVIFVRLVCN